MNDVELSIILCHRTFLWPMYMGSMILSISAASISPKLRFICLQIYAPWCGHCKSLEPEYNKLGAALKDVPSIVIAKMDGTKNDHASIKVRLGCGKLSGKCDLELCVFPAIAVIDLDSNGDHIGFSLSLLLVQLQAFPTILFYPAGKKTEDPVRRLSQSLKFTYLKPKVKCSKNLKLVTVRKFYLMLLEMFLSPSDIYELSHIHLRSYKWIPFTYKYLKRKS